MRWPPLPIAPNQPGSALAAQSGVGYLTGIDMESVRDAPGGLSPNAVRALGLVPVSEVEDGRIRVACAAPVPRPPQPTRPTRMRSDPVVAPSARCVPSALKTAALVVTADSLTKLRRDRSEPTGEFIAGRVSG